MRVKNRTLARLSTVGLASLMAMAISVVSAQEAGAQVIGKLYSFSSYDGVFQVIGKLY